MSKVWPSGSFQPLPRLQDASWLPGRSPSPASLSSIKRRTPEQHGGEDGADAANPPDPDLQGGEPGHALLLHLLLLLKNLLPGGVRLAGALCFGRHQLSRRLEPSSHKGGQLPSASGDLILI